MLNRSIHLVTTLLFFGVVASVVGEECSPVQCLMKCEYGFARDATGCQECACQAPECMGMTCAKGRVCRAYQPDSNLEAYAVCADPLLPVICQDPMDKGKCKALLPRWYYDQDQGDCVQFLYSGCGGNHNQFPTRAECQGSCGIGSGRSGCREPDCSELCRHGYQKDANGCKVCQCAKLNDHLGDDNEEFQVGVGCDGDGEAYCDLQCPHGYQMDSNGCTLCACMSPADCPQLDKGCPYCPHGVRVDERGCEICECREEGECPRLACPVLCPYGREVDQNGCERCMCIPDPCKTTDCPFRTICKPSNTTAGFVAKCLTESSYNNPGCPEKQCRMMCEYGFKTDRRGCEVCDCIKNQTECTPTKCEPCYFGYAHTEEGCPTCTCLPDPCLAKVCGGDEACVAIRYQYCEDCNPYPKCVATSHIELLMVRMEFQYQSDGVTDFSVLETELRKQMSELMEVEENLIGKIQIDKAESSEKTISVKYHVLKSDNRDLVSQYKSYRDKLLRKEPSHHGFTVDGVQFIPRTESLMASYSQEEEASMDESSSGDDGTTAIVVGCVIGLILLAVLVALVIIMIKNKKEKSRKNIIYRKAEQSQNI